MQWYILNETISKQFPLSVLFLGLKFSLHVHLDMWLKKGWLASNGLATPDSQAS